MCVLTKHREEQSSVGIVGENLHRIGDISAEFGRVGRNLPGREEEENQVAPVYLVSLPNVSWLLTPSDEVGRRGKEAGTGWK